MGRAKLLCAVLLTASALILAGCWRASGSANTTAKPTEVMKPQPTVEGVKAATGGGPGNYFAIVDVTVKNEGADGAILVVASIAQAGQTQEGEQAIFILHNSRQVVRLIFPLKWKGGDWTPSVQAKVP